VRPRLGFLGVGWIGRNRMLAIAHAGCADVVAVADADGAAATDAIRAVADVSPGGHVADAVTPDVVTPGALLDGSLGLDGVVIATPSALHAEQAMAALGQGSAVFCQKPLGRTASECAAVVDAARRVDRLLGVDLSYRHLDAVARMRQVIDTGGIGEVYAADLVFHNAYGPDKAWFTDPVLSGGGCVIDLGIHLVDLALWLLGRPKVEAVDARLFAAGRPLGPAAAAGSSAVEDHAMARLDLADGGAVSIACSWFLSTGCDAVIGATFHGTEGAVALSNVDGSFYDFRADLHRGTRSEALALPPDDWGGRAATAWARRLGDDPTFDPAVDEVVEVAAVIDRIYDR
jgi:predicted dehydrogenase